MASASDSASASAAAASAAAAFFLQCWLCLLQRLKKVSLSLHTSMQAIFMYRNAPCATRNAHRRDPAAQEANLWPVIFRLDNDRLFSFVRACRETSNFIDIDWANAGQAQAFQTLYGEALATSHVQSALVALEETAPLLPKGTTVSTRNLRKGRT